MTRITSDGRRRKYVDDVEPRTLLVSYLRENLGKVGTVIVVDTNNCGACWSTSTAAASSRAMFSPWRVDGHG